MIPPIRVARAAELLRNRPIVLFGMQRAVFAGRIVQQQIEDGFVHLDYRLVAFPACPGAATPDRHARDCQLCDSRADSARYALACYGFEARRQHSMQAIAAALA